MIRSELIDPSGDVLNERGDLVTRAVGTRAPAGTARGHLFNDTARPLPGLQVSPRVTQTSYSISAVSRGREGRRGSGKGAGERVGSVFSLPHALGWLLFLRQMNCEGYSLLQILVVRMLCFILFIYLFINHLEHIMLLTTH